jgi:hypothetical protein
MPRIFTLSSQREIANRECGSPAPQKWIITAQGAERAQRASIQQEARSDRFVTGAFTRFPLASAVVSRIGVMAAVPRFQLLHFNRKRGQNNDIKPIPIKNLTSEERADELASSPEMQPYLELCGPWRVWAPISE